MRDGKPGINPVNQPETTTTPATLIDKPAGDKNVLIYRQAADQFGVMLSPETITRLLSGQRSDMLMAVDNKVGKLILMNQPDSPPVLKLLEKKEQLTIPTKVAGYALTTTDRDNLTKYGEMGKLVPMVSAAGKPFNGYVGIDKDLNTITVLKEHQFKLPQSIKGVTLDASQREQLKGGHSVPLENMEGKNGPFHAFVRISASNGKLTFQPIRNIEAYKKSVVPPAQTAEATPNKSVARPGPTRQPLTPAVTVRTNAAPALGTAKNKPDKALTTNLRQSESNKSKPVPKQSRPKQKIK